MNLKEIFIWGIRRSGNHMMVDFILDHRYYNGLSDIEKSKARQRKFRGKKILLNDYFKDHHYRKDLEMKSNGIMKGYPDFNKRLPPPYPELQNLQIISYETNPGIENQKYSNTINIFEDPDKVIPDTKREVSEKYGIVILRDPFNWLASLGKDKKRRKNIDNFIDIWIKTAETFFINKPNDYYFPLNYNKFVKDINYRKLVSSFINENFSDKGMNRVSSKGSSFDKYKYDGKAKKMPVDKRWKNMPEEIMQKIIKNKKLIKLSEDIFNFNPLEGDN